MTPSPPYIGQLAAKESQFCPLAAVNKWPYRFIAPPDQGLIDKAFFACGEFRKRGWTLYYIDTLLPSQSKPLILVRAEEVQALFDDIMHDLKLIVSFPKKNREPGFLLSFTEEGIPRPQYLGRLDQNHSLDDMEALIPRQQHVQYQPARPHDRSFKAFREKMEAAVEASRRKAKAQREKKKKERIGVKQSWCEQMKRAQCYLGVRPRVNPRMRDPVADPNVPPRELERAIKRYNLAQSTELPDLDLTLPAPFPFLTNVVFICVDVEAYEKEPRPVTEIGISILDTNDLVDLPPGHRGANWMEKIRSRHFRITETAHLHNSEFVTGCADRFEFGESEFCSINEAPQVVASCFRPPYSAPSSNAIGDADASDQGKEEIPKRQLILVGHDTQTDIRYLRKTGYDVANLSNLVEALDTGKLWCAWKHEYQPPSLGSILVELELVGWNLHNAGNDAAYTLQALIGLIISARRFPPNYESQRQFTDRAEREARDRAKESADEWAVADQEGGDGGPPKPLDRFGWEDQPAVLNTKRQVSAEKKTSSARVAKEPATEEKKDVMSYGTAAERAAVARKEEEARELRKKRQQEEEEQWEAANSESKPRAEQETVGEKDESKNEDDPTKTSGVVFESGIMNRLAMLQGGGAAVGGGVKLPSNLDGV